MNIDSNSMTESVKPKLFTKDFTLVVIGQIISLFGNTILRFALPLYILSVSGSPALFGIVSATAFIPMTIMSPVGGIIADRVNKQKIMVVLDFFTAGLIVVYMLLNGIVSLVPLVIIFLMTLYGIQGAYQPAVQASMPILAKGELLMPANAVINLVQSLSGLLGPVIGGMIYALYGLDPILKVGFICFMFSAIMELFIKIPHKKQESVGNVWQIIKSDMSLSLRFMIKENPVMIKVIGLIFCFNLFMSAMLVIGLPVIITQNLGYSGLYYGITEGAMGAGGLIGGIIAGVFGNKINIRKTYLMLLFCGIGALPMSLTLLFGAPSFVSYLIITVMGFLLMVGSMLFSIQMLAFVQRVTPLEIVGKVISCLMALCMCAMPFGQAVYGVLFEQLRHMTWIIILGAAVLSCITALFSKTTFSKISE